MPRSLRNREKGERAWPNPHFPTDSAFEEICTEHGIHGANAISFKTFLSELVEHTGSYLDKLRNRGLQSSAHKEIAQHATRIAEVIASIKKYDRLPVRGRWFPVLAPFGSEEISQAAGYYLSDLVNPSFLPPIVGGSPPTSRSSLDQRAAQHWVNNFLSLHSGTILAAVLEQVHNTLLSAGETMRQAHTKGGRQGYLVGPHLLLNLASQYAQFGKKKPAKSVKGPFGRFAVDVVAGIGLPTTWIEGHIADAVRSWEQKTAMKPPIKTG